MATATFGICFYHRAPRYPGLGVAPYHTLKTFAIAGALLVLTAAYRP
jgi:hypothetical protein